MPSVWIPALMRELTGGQGVVQVSAGTVGEAIEKLEERYPGVKARLLEGGRLRPGIVVVVDGATSARKLRHPLSETSEVHFLPAIGGGSDGPGGRVWLGEYGTEEGFQSRRRVKRAQLVGG